MKRSVQVVEVEDEGFLALMDAFRLRGTQKSGAAPMPEGAASAGTAANLWQLWQAVYEKRRQWRLCGLRSDAAETH